MGPFSRIPWKFVLPAAMVGATAALLHFDKVWGRGAGYWDDMPITTAWGLLALLNGPGFWLSRFFSFFASDAVVLLIGSGAFWMWSGYLFDKRLKGIRKPMIGKTWLRIGLYCVGLGLACLIAFAAVESQRFAFTNSRYIPWLLDILKSKSPKRTLLGREVLAVAGIVWGVGYAAYFLAKLVTFVVGGRSETPVATS